MKKLIKVMFLFVVIFSLTASTFASTIQDVKDERDATEKKKQEAEALLSGLETEKDDILSAIEDLDIKANEFQIELDGLYNEQELLNASIVETQERLVIAKEEEAQQYEDMKVRIQNSYENGNVEYLDTIFTSSDFTEIINKSEYVEQISLYDANMFDKLVSIREEIANTEAKLQIDLTASEELSTRIEADKEVVDGMISEKSNQIVAYNESIEEYEGLIAQYEADSQALDVKLNQLEAAAREQISSGGGGYGNLQDVYIGGALTWPVPSTSAISSYFGYRGWVGAGTTYHNGIDIPCSVGTPIVAAADGIVVDSGYSSSMGNYVMIIHSGDMSTVYMHNSSLAVGTGQSVSAGEVIAYAGSTGWSTGPHCHFGLKVNGSYIDPLPYLQ